MCKKVFTKNAILFSIALTLIALCFSGCETAGETGEVPEEEAPFISTEEMLADYDYMWAVLEDQFPFWTEAERTGYLTRDEIIAVKEEYREQIIRTTEIFSEEKPFQGEIWLLVDGHCASSSELLVRFCQDTGAATIIGSQTRGSGGVGYSPIYKRMELPNSGMCIEFEWIAYLNSDGTFNNFEGTMPDIETDEDALEVCLDLIKK